MRPITLVSLTRPVLVASLAACLYACGTLPPAGQAPPAGPASTAAPPATPAAPATACDGASGRVLWVGPGRKYRSPSEAAAVAQSGDVIKISAGDYHGDVAVWSANNLTICGVGGRARLFADGKDALGKGLWVVTGANLTLDSLEFHDATVPDQNGAGIRDEHTGSLVIRNSGFFDNENGILGGSGHATITLERCEFARNGYGDGYTHNIYIGAAARLTVIASYFHEAKVGHNLKSRARETIIENSYFMDGPGGTASYLVDFPNGGRVYLRGNLFQKGPAASNSTSISYGAETITWTVNTLELVHNTLVSTRPGGTFVAARNSTQSLRMIANVFAGSGGTALVTGLAVGAITQQGNFIASAQDFPHVTDIASPGFWPDPDLQARLALPEALDPGYTHDSPAPFVLRPITTATRLAGALQAPP
ncbi:MAG: hypothetical protein JSR67_02660 [Proteobacteria bacterium]|nr:hypothetical protein [Pseudomonadota bacterium]